MTYWFWFGLVFVFQLATWIILADIGKLISRFLVADTALVNRWHTRVVFGLFLLTFLFMGWKTYKDTTQIVTDELSIAIDDLPASLKGFKLVHISDIQGDEYTGRKEIARYVEAVNATNPDLIIFTGDLISYGTDFIAMSAQELGKVRATYGTIAVVGDHDYWAGTPNIEQALANEGIPLLQNQNQKFSSDGDHTVRVTGITEVYSKTSDPEVVDSVTNNAGGAALKIFASHQVDDDLVAEAQQNGYDMMLAGHTHGGQIRVPFFGMGFSAAERETKYVSGLYHKNKLPIHINNGLGFTLGPIRYDAQPTVTVITLKEKDR
ncbi:metallophosphoesterase [Fodinibius salinus]|uniref:metallophosphoesterase n=1 Tax=Fodinibius salinus TaxID=860790 RepID=UPI001B880F3D|nr:metallophosphoesterase [Fodinibius salinus]